jgi:hypothetical protein
MEMVSKLVELWVALKGWRTLLLSLALAVVGVLQTADWANIVGPAAVGPVMMLISAAVAVLRLLTNTPVGTK